MGHNLQALGTASLDTMGGLVTLADPRDVPEGASPRCWDVDFIVGSVFTRPGLKSVYSYATTLIITAYVLSYGVATFTYVGPEPTINEGFFLSGFLGSLSYLNGLEVFVEAVTPTTFTVLLNFPDDGPVVNLSASAVSTTGVFLGPNLGSSTTGPTWSSPSNLFSTLNYASVATGGNITDLGIPTSASNVGSGVTWSNPSNAITTGASYATVSLSSNSSAYVMENNASFNVPAGAVITGIAISFKAQYSGTGSASVNAQIQDGNSLLGTAVNVPLATSLTTYTKGSSSYLWGTSFNLTQLNSGVFGVALQAVATGGTANVSINTVTVTVYYTVSAISGTLLGQGFGFAVSLSSGISGFNASFKAYSSTNTTVSLQLLQNGIPVGTAKTQALTTTPTVYSLGAANDLWGYLWSAGNVNSNTFGVQIVASGTGTTYIGDLDLITFITAAMENFNYIGSYEQNNMALTTLALDAGGNLWKEDVQNNPGVLSLALSGLLPNTFAKSATMNNQEFLMFSDLSIGSERPRLMTVDGTFYPVTQVAPGVAPSFQASTGSVQGVLSLTSYSQSGQVGTFNFTAVSTPPTQGSLYVVAGTGTALDGQVLIVLSGATTTSFTADVKGTIANGNYTGTLTPQFAYGITSITQIPIYAHMAPQLGFLLGSAPTQNGVGTCVTVWYNVYGFPADPDLLASMSDPNAATFIIIKNAVSGSYNFNGIWQVTSVGQAYYPGTSKTGTYFCFTFTQSGSLNYTNITGASYQLTAATLTMATPVASLTAGTQITITGVTPQTGWNQSWTISESINDGQYTITSTQYNSTGSGTATYGFSLASLTNSQRPVVGNVVRISGCTNAAGFNGTFVISGPGSVGTVIAGSTFTVALTLPLPTQGAPVLEGSAQAVMFGTKFKFDPGETFVGTNTNVIYGNASNGSIAVIGSSLVPIGAGTRQAICFFITKSGNWTPASPPVTFTVATDANLLNLSNIPIGPSNVVARGIAITEAGQNGVPGANFYVIEEPVIDQVNGSVYTSTIINDNITQQASFSFTDAVLLNSTEIDIPGFNLFNLIELGSCGWCIPYASRMFYGLQLNKVDNFDNLTFDGGYIAPNQPAGWNLYLTTASQSGEPSPNELTLVQSPVTGSALYISNTTGSIQTQMGTIAQTAYQDVYKVAILQPNTEYSARVACSCPSGVRLGTLVLDLVDLSGGSFGTVYGSFSVPLQSMGSTVTVFSGVLLTNGTFTGAVSSNLQFRVRVQNMGVGADTLIDRIEVYPTAFPYLKTEVYGSYIGKPESVDASGDGGIIDTSTENPQPCMGAFVLRDSLYLLKTNSMYVTKDNPNSEPSGWSLNEVSSRVGAVGIHAYDTGDEWAVMACRSGIYGFSSGIPQRLTEEIFQIWEAINWNAGNTIVLRNDTVNRRILCAIPLPTGTNPVTGVKTASVPWLPYAPYNPSPTTPNVMLMLNYQALSTFEELVNQAQMHTTMFGTLAVQDMKRKWTVWQIASPYMDFITRANYNDRPLFICNGISTSKIYQLDQNTRSDDGSAIYSLYTTYGFVNAAKAVTMPIFGMHAKRYTILQFTAEGFGTLGVKMYPNSLDARYPWSVPTGVTLANTEQDDFYRNLNVKGNRMFVEVSTNAVGAWFQLHKMLLTGKADVWSSLNPAGGGNAGIV